MFISNNLLIDSTKEYLLFIPHAGGSGENFLPWFRYFPEKIGCRYILLPGRGKRLSEPAFSNMSALISAITPECLRLCDKPLSIFGHSMGALIAFELAKALQFNHVILKRLFISGCRAPHLSVPIKLSHLAPDELYLQLEKLGGCHDFLKNNFKYFEYFYPILINDLALCESYHYEKGAKLKCPISIFWGMNDEMIAQEKIYLWKNESNFETVFHSFPGSHFYLNEYQDLVIKAICRHLEHESL